MLFRVVNVDLQYDSSAIRAGIIGLRYPRCLPMPSILYPRTVVPKYILRQHSSTSDGIPLISPKEPEKAGGTTDK
ncbi:Hypothetical protein NTJ_09750 [Nesidiocoris tenuis]|uniref:Uncharacterized protein n=1 Tax=Nesidiocoris tenuis TaxID=355587 RepID=A0ABN7B2G3_9HEMI|nr:Hypothetical protein NTJ_09750 [Nesidiocoris tenuis]